MIELDSNALKWAIVVSFLLTVMKILGWINIGIWLILLPIFIVIGIWFIIIFLIGLITVYMVAEEMSKDTGESEKEA